MGNKSKIVNVTKKKTKKWLFGFLFSGLFLALLSLIIVIASVTIIMDDSSNPGTTGSPINAEVEVFRKNVDEELHKHGLTGHSNNVLLMIQVFSYYRTTDPMKASFFNENEMYHHTKLGIKLATYSITVGVSHYASLIKKYSSNPSTPTDQELALVIECYVLGEEYASYCNQNYSKETASSYYNQCINVYRQQNVADQVLSLKGTVNNDNNSSWTPNGGSEIGNSIVTAAMSKRGSLYYWGAQGPDMFDCSGLVYWSHKQAGLSTPRLPAREYANYGNSVAYDQLQPGDVITFKTVPTYVSHIGIYIGNGQMVHAYGLGSGTIGNKPNENVQVASVERGSIYYNMMYNCRRLY